MNSLPDANEILKNLDLLIQGLWTREDIVAWADSFEWWNDDLHPEAPGAIWDIVSTLSMAANPASPEGYLYQPEDFQQWRDEFIVAMGSPGIGRVH